MTAEVELQAVRSTASTVDGLWRNLVSMIHLTPFIRNLDAHLVVVLHRGDASLAGLAVNATASNHFIHNNSNLNTLIGLFAP